MENEKEFYDFEVGVYDDEIHEWETVYYGDSKKAAFKELEEEKKNGKVVRLIWI